MFRYLGFISVSLISSIALTQPNYTFNCKVDRLFDDRVFGPGLREGSEVSLQNNGRNLVAVFGKHAFMTPDSQITKVKDTHSIVSYKVKPAGNWVYEFYVNIHYGHRPLGGELSMEGESSYDSRVVAFIVCP